MKFAKNWVSWTTVAISSAKVYSILVKVFLFLVNFVTFENFKNWRALLGKTGDWKNHFSPELNARIDMWIESNLKGTDLTFITELEQQDWLIQFLGNDTHCHIDQNFLFSSLIHQLKIQFQVAHCDPPILDRAKFKSLNTIHSLSSPSSSRHFLFLK